jgi:predicted transcriptional regulator
MDRSETAYRMVTPRGKAHSKAITAPMIGYELESPRSSTWAAPFSFPSAAKPEPPSERPRSSLKISLDILESVRDEGASKRSKIICMANLSTKRSVKYLGELVSRGLLMETRDGTATCFTLTAKGLEFVNQVKEAEAFVAGFGLTI